MIETVSSPPSLGDTPDRQPPNSNQPEPVPYEQRPQAATPTSVAAPEPRLVVEADPKSGELTYSLINRQTGEITRVSKDDLVQMSQNPKYSAGAVIDTKA